MRTIHKYHIPIINSCSRVNMPDYAKLLHVGVQKDEIYLWAAVDTDQPIVAKQFIVLGTGHEIPDFVNRELYIGTAILLDGAFVGHVFEVS